MFNSLESAQGCSLSTIQRLWDRWCRAQIQSHSAVLAFHSLLCVIPFLGFVFLVLRHAGISPQLSDIIRDFVLSHLNISSSFLPKSVFNALISPQRLESLRWIGIVVGIYTTLNITFRLGISLDHVLHTSPDKHHIEKRSGWRRFLRQLSVLMGLPISLLISLGITHWIKTDSFFHKLLNLETVGSHFFIVLGWSATILALFLIYWLIPQSHVPKVQAMKAALIAGPVSEIVRFGFGAYGHYSFLIHRVYGVFMAIPLFILWMQVAWIIILAGALFIRFPPQD